MDDFREYLEENFGALEAEVGVQVKPETEDAELSAFDLKSLGQFRDKFTMTEGPLL